MFYSSLQAAISHSIYSNVNLKVKQVICLEAIYHGRDVVAVLPTGYGRSVIFHLLHSLFLDKITYEHGAAAHPVVIVFSPLNALTKDQIRRLQEEENKLGRFGIRSQRRQPLAARRCKIRGDLYTSRSLHNLQARNRVIPNCEISNECSCHCN